MIVTVKVSVTDSDIDNGVRGDCWKCPVALAMWRATGWKWNVGSVYSLSQGERVPSLCVIGRGMRLDMPDKVLRFIRDYDDRATVYPAKGLRITGFGKRAAQPFEFEIDVPEEYVVTGAKTEAKTDSASRPAR